MISNENYIIISHHLKYNWIIATFDWEFSSKSASEGLACYTYHEMYCREHTNCDGLNYNLKNRIAKILKKQHKQTMYNQEIFGGL